VNYSNDSVFLTHVYLSVFQPNKFYLFIKVAPVSLPYCLPSLLATANQISRTSEAVL